MIDMLKARLKKRRPHAPSNIRRDDKIASALLATSMVVLIKQTINIYPVMHQGYDRLYKTINYEKIGELIPKKTFLKEIDIDKPKIEEPINFLYKAIYNIIDGLFYRVEEVPERGPGYIIRLLIVVPKKNYEVEGRIYKEIGSLMREYPDDLFDFSIIRRYNRDIRVISEGYKGYVYP